MKSQQAPLSAQVGERVPGDGEGWAARVGHGTPHRAHTPGALKRPPLRSSVGTGSLKRVAEAGPGEFFIYFAELFIALFSGLCFFLVVTRFF